MGQGSYSGSPQAATERSARLHSHPKLGLLLQVHKFVGRVLLAASELTVFALTPEEGKVFYESLTLGKAQPLF